MRIITWRLLPLGLFLLLAFFLWRGLSLDPQNLPSVQLGKSLPSYNLPLLDDSLNTFTPANLKNHVTLLNVWASWCPACIDEQVFLLQLAREGVAIYGLNYKDTPNNAKKWLATWGNPYRMIGQDRDGKVGIDLGVYGAPETFVIDKKGIIRYRHVGVLNQAIWMKTLLPLIQTLERAL